jgi:hypothetical protein
VEFGLAYWIEVLFTIEEIDPLNEIFLKTYESACEKGTEARAVARGGTQAGCGD